MGGPAGLPIALFLGVLCVFVVSLSYDMQYGVA